MSYSVWHFMKWLLFYNEKLLLPVSILRFKAVRKRFKQDPSLSGKLSRIPKIRSYLVRRKLKTNKLRLIINLLRIEMINKRSKGSLNSIVRDSRRKVKKLPTSTSMRPPSRIERKKEAKKLSFLIKMALKEAFYETLYSNGIITSEFRGEFNVDWVSSCNYFSQLEVSGSPSSRKRVSLASFTKMRVFFQNKISSLVTRKLIGQKSQSFFAKNSGSLSNLVKGGADIAETAVVFFGVFNQMERRKRKAKKVMMSRTATRSRPKQMGNNGPSLTRLTLASPRKTDSPTGSRLRRSSPKRLEVRLAQPVNETRRLKNKLNEHL